MSALVLFFLDYRLFCPHTKRKHEGRFYQEALVKDFSAGRDKNVFFECVLQDSLIVFTCVREGGDKREVWQLKAFPQGHPHHLARPVNPDSHSLVVCLLKNSQSFPTPPCRSRLPPPDFIGHLYCFQVQRGGHGYWML